MIFVDYSLFKDRKNEFAYKLPNTDNTVTFKILTHKDEQSIGKEVAGLKKINKNNETQITTRLKHLITSVNGISDVKDIREFVDNFLLAKDARALREYYGEVSPDMDLKFVYTDEDGGQEDVDLPITVNFFRPDARV